MGRITRNLSSPPCSKGTTTHVRPGTFQSNSASPSGHGKVCQPHGAAPRREAISVSSPTVVPRSHTGPRLGRATRAASLSDDAVGLIGAGSFATAMASVLSTRALAPVLYSEDREIVRDINHNHANHARLPGVSLARRVAATSDLEELAGLCRLVIVAVSSRQVVRTARALGAVLSDQHIVAHAVGALAGDDRRVSQILTDHAGAVRIAALAGPALPGDLTARRSCAIVAASEDDDVLGEIKRLLHTPPALRIYKNRDLAGVELAAALASAVTVAIGLADGFGIGHGPRALFVTRAAGEAAALCRANGADPRTFYGLAGLGNLLVRCSPESRADSIDYQLGVAIGRGVAPPRGQTEGVRMLATARRIADLTSVPAPILRITDDVVGGRLTALDAADRLQSWETDLE